MGELGDLDAEVPLQVWGSGAQPSKARRRAGVVYREPGPWSDAVLALLRHLENAGFAGAPRVVGSGFADDGREMVSLAGRARQLRLILDGYGVPARQRGGFVDKMITFAVHSARAEAVEFGVTPQTTAGVSSTGYPFVWAITWRARSASWMLTRRTHLQRAIS